MKLGKRGRVDGEERAPEHDEGAPGRTGHTWPRGGVRGRDCFTKLCFIDVRKRKRFLTSTLDHLEIFIPNGS